MKCTAISDLHGFFPESLPGGDLLIVAGDLTGSDTEDEHREFQDWLWEQEYKKKIYIAGNHDTLLTKDYFKLELEFDYLCDSGIEYKGLKIYGSPWSLRFPGMNPKCMAFTVDTEVELLAKWAEIPADTDILVTHCPPWGILDKCDNGLRVGSPSLRNRVDMIRPRYHIFGHLHESYGIEKHGETTFINCSHVNERYEPVNEPITLEV